MVQYRKPCDVALILVSVSCLATGQDANCETGIRHDRGSNNLAVCCPATCGGCTGTGCSSWPGGDANCCLSSILALNASCSEASPPCAMYPTPSPSPSLCSEPLSATALGQELALSAWKVQLPETGASCGTSTTVCEKSGVELESFYDRYAFGSANGEVTFCVPLNGAHTPNTHYPRAELEELRRWPVPSGSTVHSLSAKVKVLRLAQYFSESKASTIIGQVHGDSSKPFAELLKLRWNGKHNYVDMLTKAENGEDAAVQVLTDSLQLGDDVNYTIQVAGSNVKVVVNGRSAKYDYSFLNASANMYYFKAGNYCQNAGNVADDGCVITMKDVWASHESTMSV